MQIEEGAVSPADPVMPAAEPPPPTLATLPAELLPAVLRHLRPRDLARCAAACRALHAAAMPVLLRTLRPARPHFPALERALANPRLARMVRELDLGGMLGRTHAGTCLRLATATRKLRIRLAYGRLLPDRGCLAPLEGLEDLEVLCDDGPGTGFLNGMELPPSLRRVSIEMIDSQAFDPSPEVLDRIDRGCPRLETLELLLSPHEGTLGFFLGQLVGNHPRLVEKLCRLRARAGAVPEALADHPDFPPEDLELHFCGAAETVPDHLWDALLRSRFRRLALRRLPTAALLRGIPRAELLELRDLRPCIPDTAFVRVIASVRERVGKVSIVDIEGSGPEHAAWRALAGLPEPPEPPAIGEWQPTAEPPPPTSDS
ncbi:hypothetical protein DFJ74DRAFT_773835 [Hyaloraphidium curvatum]|nr:hypothetical protein DFJ74DRAFT_773835 [Hyaloraphidium curvatum]